MFKGFVRGRCEHLMTTPVGGVGPAVTGRKFASAPRVPPGEWRGARGRRDGGEVGRECHWVSVDRIR